MQTKSNPSDVILADDDQDDLYFFKLAMEKIPVRIVLRHAANTEQLFKLLKALIPDVLFLDVNMPGHDGITSIAKIRADKRYDFMPVIILSDIASGKQIEEAYRKGANFFIGKNADLDLLSSKLEKVLTRNWKQEMIYPTLAEFIL
jgi:DNA-binding NarL/FixJ family response regulator